ncbi:hypothetical protein V2E24_00245 [Mycoplasmopsis ciconiae]|uniref:DNA-directed DNA polymerase n=1 Tax=Mycoplasmopsis ciconiae TaxID=561067 RepID=A0ABU7MKE6_9BACT|nr:hypothetical protein [Mycoplasmopsis ciconiae]
MKLIYGIENFFIENEITKIKKKFDDQNIVIFEPNTPVNEIEEKIANNNIFDQAKLFIIKNLDILASKGAKMDNYQSLLRLLKNINQNNYKNTVVFVANVDKLNSNSFSAFLLDNSQVFLAKSLEKKSLFSVIQNYIKKNNGEISHDNLTYFLEIMPDDLNVIINEVNKLLLENKNISAQMINNSISVYNKNDIFAFSNSLSSANFESIYRKLLERLNENTDVISLIAQFSDLVINAYKYYAYAKIDLKEAQMANLEKIHPFRIKSAGILLRRYGIKKVIHLIKELQKLDFYYKNVGDSDADKFKNFIIKEFIDF